MISQAPFHLRFIDIIHIRGFMLTTGRTAGSDGYVVVGILRATWHREV